MNDSRRNFIRNAALASLGFVGLNQCMLTGLRSVPGNRVGYGKLIYTKGNMLSLPEKFSASVISRTGEVMTDGLISPGSHDGMGIYGLNNQRMILIRNHELTPGSFDQGPFGKRNELIGKISKDKIYDFAKQSDKMCVGGTTTLVYNEESRKVESEYLSLVGTVRNCSGGRTPWNTWISCEETAFKKGDETGQLEKNHGYNFEVPATDKISLTDPVPIKAMGRFVHESIAVHPATGIVYQTEDEGNGLLYRYIPDATGDLSAGSLQKGGRLQCLVLRDWNAADTRNYATSKTQSFPEKKLFDTIWVDLDDIDSPDNDLRIRGHQKGAAIFSSGEGMIYGNNEVFFTASSGGKSGNGQVFRYIPGIYEGQPREKDAPGKLELFIESKSKDTFRFCDNITVAPWGDLIICEDKVDARIIGITPKGESYVVAQNIEFRESEFAGPVFSPSGKTLFVNIQSPGLTLAITGPWKI
ncbi:MAG TPA: alkaline phosphatase PhoX [Flavitalea sp.]|nr:alkaline phosphatase PhoX [Flavitalea sp.]